MNVTARATFIEQSTDSLSKLEFAAKESELKLEFSTASVALDKGTVRQISSTGFETRANVIKLFNLQVFVISQSICPFLAFRPF
jgi:hypothetical protein